MSPRARGAVGGRVRALVHVPLAGAGLRAGAARHGRAAVERRRAALHRGHARAPARRQRAPPAAPPPRPLPQLVQYISNRALYFEYEYTHILVSISTHASHRSARAGTRTWCRWAWCCARRTRRCWRWAACPRCRSWACTTCARSCPRPPSRCWRTPGGRYHSLPLCSFNSLVFQFKSISVSHLKYLLFPQYCTEFVNLSLIVQLQLDKTNNYLFLKKKIVIHVGIHIFCCILISVLYLIIVNCIIILFISIIKYVSISQRKCY